MSDILITVLAMCFSIAVIFYGFVLLVFILRG